MLNAASVMSFSVLWSDRERAVSHMMGFPRDSSRNEACLSVYYHPTIILNVQAALFRSANADSSH